MDPASRAVAVEPNAPESSSASSSSEAAALEPFSAVFSVLRERLQRQINAPDAAAAEAARVNAPCDPCGVVRGPSAAIARLADRVPVRAFAAPTTGSAYRDQRRRIGLRRERLQQRGRAVRSALDASLAERLQRLREDSDAFHDTVNDAYANALRRLQALCVECVTEMHKAVERARTAFATRVITDEEDLRRQLWDLRVALQWRVFLARLEEDTQRELQARLLVPSAGMSAAQLDTSALVRELARLIATNGPVLPHQDGVVIDTVIAFADRHDASGVRPDEPRASVGGGGGARKTPSLHFVESMAAAWSDTTTPWRPTTSASSSGGMNKPRRVTPPVSANSPVLFNTTATGHDWSSLRRVVAPLDARVSRWPVATLLSCSAITWLLSRWTQGDADASQPLSRLRDANVYIALQECCDESLTLAAPSEDDSATAQFVRQREQQLQRLARAANADASDVKGSDQNTTVVADDGTLFVPATLLELLQTRYARDEFLPRVRQDIERFEDVFSTWLHELRTIQALYVAMETAPDGAVRMVALDTECLHEMCVLYVARGVCTKKATRRTVSSLAKADALSILPPARTADAKFCLARCAPSLLRAALAAGGESPSPPEWIGQRPMLFVEYHLEPLDTSQGHAGGGGAGGTVSINKKKEVLRILGPVCAWRSCLDTATQATPGSGLALCDWHKCVQSSVSDAEHFLPNLKDLKASWKPPDEQRHVETVKKLLIKSSSLLEELTARQLGQSIAAFLEHAKRSLSNRSFEESRGHRTHEGGGPPESDSDEEIDEEAQLSSRCARLDAMRQVLAVEHAITAALEADADKDLAPLPPELLSEWSELDRDLRADDDVPLLELSRRKLALLHRLRSGENGNEPVCVTRLTHSLSDGVIARRGGGAEREAAAQLFPRPRPGDMRTRVRQQTKAARPKSATQRKTLG